jgi:hypothetical protein
LNMDLDSVLYLVLRDRVVLQDEGFKTCNYDHDYFVYYVLVYYDQ